MASEESSGCSGRFGAKAVMNDKVKFWILLLLLCASMALIWYVNSTYSMALLGPIH